MNKQNKVSSELVYQGPVFTMTHDIMEMKDGRQFPRDVIHHHGGVAVLVIKEGKILFVRQYRYALQQETLEIPAGKLEQGEDPYTCGMRELEEESGYGCQNMKLICEMYSTPGFCNEKIFIYEAFDLFALSHPKAMDEDEEIETLWIPIEEAYAMIAEKKIVDAKTVLAVQHAFIHR